VTDDDINPPPLPRGTIGGLCGTNRWFSAAHMRDYARAAVKADRARRAAQPAPTDKECLPVAEPSGLQRAARNVLSAWDRYGTADSLRKCPESRMDSRSPGGAV
jgi:hypothetical protein